MPNIYVEKKELLDILVKNKERHIKIYNETVVAFKKKYIKEIKSILQKAEKNRFESYINLTPPRNNKTSYDQAIKMVKLSSRDEIELSNSEFSNYVMDKWGWTSSFCSSVTSTSSTSSMLSTTSKSYIDEMNQEIEED